MLRSGRTVSAALRNVKGGSSLKGEEKFFPIIPLRHPSQRTSARFKEDVIQTMAETANKLERARIKDEITRGYFQDMRELQKHGGKISTANSVIIPETHALKFPPLEVYFTDGSKLELPMASKLDTAKVSSPKLPLTSKADGSKLEPPVTSKSDTAEVSSPKLPLTSKANDTNVSISDTAKASLICLSFREHSVTMIDSWTSPFLKSFGQCSDIRLYEVSLIDSWLLSRKLIRKPLLKRMRKPAPEEKQHALQRQIVYSFGDHYYFRKELKIVNLLTGYMFLLDKFGRIRWSGNGTATEGELASLLSCTSILLEEN